MDDVHTVLVAKADDGGAAFWVLEHRAMEFNGGQRGSNGARLQSKKWRDLFRICDDIGIYSSITRMSEVAP